MARRTVSEVAALAGVTVRTLHHYDDIGLLRPAERTDAGYRLYDDGDVARLHAIVTWRSLGFPLDEVRALLDDPDQEPLETMRLHRSRLLEEIGELHARVAALDEAIRRAAAREPLSDADLRALFDGFDPAAFADEAEAVWGHTDAFREAQRRTARYTAEDWRALRAEADALHGEMATCMQAGVAPDTAKARVLAERHRAHISRWFYDCTAEIHRGLADLYDADPRFAGTYDRVASGLAEWLVAAIRALHAPRPRQL